MGRWGGKKELESSLRVLCLIVQLILGWANLLMISIYLVFVRLEIHTQTNHEPTQFRGTSHYTFFRRGNSLWWCGKAIQVPHNLNITLQNRLLPLNFLVISPLGHTDTTGAEKGGILVRQGQALSSAEACHPYLEPGIAQNPGMATNLAGEMAIDD